MNNLAISFIKSYKSENTYSKAKWLESTNVCLHVFVTFVSVTRRKMCFSLYVS